MTKKCHIKRGLLPYAFTMLPLLSGCGGGGGGSSIANEPPVMSSASSAASSQSSSSSISSSSTSSALAQSTYKVIKIPAPSLSSNIINETAQRDIAVYLPKEYSTSDALLPVVYYLPGFGDSTMINMALPNDLDLAVSSSAPMIIVIISGVNRFGGSFFVNSSVTGNWSDFVAKDVVNYVDTHYRTIPKSSGRGISGHSMGGFGALNIAMRNPDVFGAVFSISPGLVGAKGIEDTQIFDSTSHIKSFITIIDPFKNVNDSAALNALDSYSQSFDIGFDIAYGMAFAPAKTPPYFEYPYKLVNSSLVRDDVIMAKWEAGFGNIHNEVAEFSANLGSLKAIGLDCGLNDEYQWILRGCDYYNTELKAAGINLAYTTHSGMHQDKIRQRIIDVMLPFFSKNLNN
ncbi:alpha/beta hydrolase [Cellvibrio sp.]|uniref:alpha/beta hydrolase n=1 Tax=Cellvibrio sp. TaxID=1965322 RepID=UPI003964763F